MNALFIHIPKTAGTSVANALNLSLPIAEGPISQFGNQGAVTFAHLSVKQLIESGCVSDFFVESAFKFAFVRNPFDRMVSLFLYRKQFDKMAMDLDFIGYLQHLKSNGIPKISVDVDLGKCTKSELLEGIRRVNYAQGQANPQLSWLDVPVDFIGRYENLKDDYSYVCERLRTNTPLAHDNRSEGKKPWQEYYCKESRDIVLRLHEIDFKDFEYSTEIC